MSSAKRYLAPPSCMFAVSVVALWLSSACTSVVASSVEERFQRARAAPRPAHDDSAAMARWLLHNADYGTVATHSTMLEGWPFASTVSVSDGARSNSTGRVLFYVATISQLAADAAADARASFSVSEASFAPGSCSDTDPEWPLCARASLLGKLVRLDGDDAQTAADLMFARHPHMQQWASMRHKWEFLELKVEQADVIAYFGGWATVAAAEYYNVTLPSGTSDSIGVQ